MRFSRRRLLETAALAGAGAALGPLTRTAQAQAKPESEPAAFAKLKPLGDKVQPIAAEEYDGRIALAQRMMSEARPALSALYVTPGTSLYYYTGVRWGISERLMALVIPRTGDPLYVCPGFEEGRLRERLRGTPNVRVWQEDESPYAVIAKWLAERHMRTGRIGVEETTRYMFYDGLRKAAPGFEYTSGDPVTVGCRARKTDHELSLMRLACAATFDALRAVFASVEPGMTQDQVAELLEQAFAKMNLRGGGLVLFGASAALPHGTTHPAKLSEGEVILIDCGTTVEGYMSDVTRCYVLGKAPEKLTRAFEIVRRAQDAALKAAVPGAECGTVDDAARKVITDAGFGPGYKYFTHRVGHGIGLDGHEQPYLVRGNKVVLQPNMTFSDEPGIYAVGDYGLRLEDDMVITEFGAAELLTPNFSPSLADPIGTAAD